MVMVFDANRIISEDSEGFVIPHGDTITTSRFKLRDMKRL